MSCLTFIDGDSVIHRLDPRGRITVALAFAVMVALSRNIPTLATGAAAAITLAVLARLPLCATLRRLIGLNLFMLMLWVFLPVTTPGTVVRELGPLTVTAEGVRAAALITVKGNVIVLVYTALLSTIEMAHLGHAMSHLRVPDKLTHLFLFTIRYVDVLHHEYQRLATAMRVRAFRPGMNMHSYRSIGYLIAMLLVGSFDRSERILAAMKCRGFSGRYYLLTHFAMARRDLFFGLVSAAVIVCCVCLEWGLA